MSNMQPHPDAELIVLCQRFAEVELENWYRYVTAPDDLADAIDDDLDVPMFQRIMAIPATTAPGWQAKALAYSAWATEPYRDAKDDLGAAMLVSLLTWMAGDARATILARMRDRYGPLPSQYTADGVWLGSVAA